MKVQWICNKCGDRNERFVNLFDLKRNFICLGCGEQHKLKLKKGKEGLPKGETEKIGVECIC
jgi:hypothetical protein